MAEENAEEASGGCDGEKERVDVAHLPFSRDSAIKIKLENKRGAGSYYKVF